MQAFHMHTQGHTTGMKSENLVTTRLRILYIPLHGVRDMRAVANLEDD